jgi:hypothetical protein
MIVRFVFEVFWNVGWHPRLGNRADSDPAGLAGWVGLFVPEPNEAYIPELQAKANLLCAQVHLRRRAFCGWM